MHIKKQVEAADQEPVRCLSESPKSMMSVTKTELVWPGKYNEMARARNAEGEPAFQVIETVNESRLA